MVIIKKVRLYYYSRTPFEKPIKNNYLLFSNRITSFLIGFSVAK